MHVFGKADEFYDYGRDGFGYKPQEERVSGWGKGLQDVPSGCLFESPKVNHMND